MVYKIQINEEQEIGETLAQHAIGGIIWYGGGGGGGGGGVGRRGGV